MSSRWVGLGLVVAVVFLVACESDDASTSTTTTAPRNRASLEIRSVAVVLPPPVDDESVGPGTGYTVVEDPHGIRYGVGPVVITEKGLRNARARNFGAGTGWVVELGLTRHATRAVNELAKEQYPLAPPQNSIAIVVDGKARSVAAFQRNSFTGGVLINNLIEAQAKAMAASLRPR